MPNLEKYLYSVREVASLLDLPEASVTRMIRMGQLQATKPGKTYKVPRKEIERLLMLSERDINLQHFNSSRELEHENETLRQQLNLLKNILDSANQILEKNGGAR